MGDVVFSERIICMYDMRTDSDLCKAYDLHKPHTPLAVFENINRYSFDRLKVKIDENQIVTVTNDDYNNFEVGFKCEKTSPVLERQTGEKMFRLNCWAEEK